MSSEHDIRTAVIECNNLTKVYRTTWSGRSKGICALQDISLRIRVAQIVGLIGPNGAGKTTLLNLMAGLIFPTKGHVAICGHFARSMEARQSLGYMPESPAFLGTYSARAVLKYHGALLGLSRHEINQETDKLIGQLELQEFADRPCSGFSQGMKQRLSLAIALMNNPKVLLLDEPSNGLDPIGIIKLRDLLKQLRDSGTTIVISSHRLGELEKLTSNFIFLYRGQVVSFDDRLVSDQSGHLRIEVISGGNDITKQLQSKYSFLAVSDTKLTINVTGEEHVPNLVCDLVNSGARITSVVLERENIENVFMRLYNERV